jgi:hypothetical protein
VPREKTITGAVEFDLYGCCAVIPFSVDAIVNPAAAF